MMTLCSQRKTSRLKLYSVSSLESFSDHFSDYFASEASGLKYSSSESLDLEPFPLIYEKTQCIFFYTGKTKKKTFSQPTKIMDHVESHLRREPGPTVTCRHPVCEATELVLKTMGEFKFHMKKDHGITLRDP